MNCDFYRRSGGKEWEEPSVVIIGDSLDDFCLYYNLHRMRSHVHWLPSSVLASYEAKKAETSKYMPDELEEGLVSDLAHHLDHQIQFDRPDSNIVLCSLSATEIELQRIGTVLNDARLIKHDSLTAKMTFSSNVTPFLPQTIRLYERHNVNRFHRELFHKKESVNFINTPRPHTFKMVPPYDHRWIAEIGIENYLLPAQQILGPETVIRRNYSSDEIRVSMDGFAYLCPNLGYFGGDLDATLVRPKLRLLDSLELSTKIFGSAGYYVSLSDKANYHTESINKFGSLESLSSFLRDDVHRELLGRYLDDSPSSSEKGIYLRERRYLSFDAIKIILKDATRAGDLLSEFVATQVFHRGLIFSCEVCRNADWYAIDEVGGTFTCSRCRKTQAYKKLHWKSPEEPQWYYKLDEIIYQGYLHNMSVPILTLDYLRRTSKTSFMYSPELDIRRDQTSQKPDLEIDFCAYADGRTIVGQATAKDVLDVSTGKEEVRLRENKEVAEAIHADTFLLSTMKESWSPRTIKSAQRFFEGSTVKLNLVTQRELLSK